MTRQPHDTCSRPPLLALLATLALYCASPCADAALGETAVTVSGDIARLKASVRIIAGTQYSVHELLTPEGTTIREFAAPNGTVFAISWRGPFKPDLRVLLGSYFDTYAHAARSPGSTRNHLAIDRQDLVVRAGGHMRAFAGAAWVPGLVPANVAPEELQ